MSAEPNAMPGVPGAWRVGPLASVAEARFSSVDKLSHPGEEAIRLCNYTDVYNNDYITADLQLMRASATEPKYAALGCKWATSLSRRTPKHRMILLFPQ